MQCNLSKVRQGAKLIATFMMKTFTDRRQMIITRMRPINDILDWYPLLQMDSGVYIFGLFDCRFYVLVIEINNV